MSVRCRLATNCVAKSAEKKLTLVFLPEGEPVDTCTLRGERFANQIWYC